MCVNSLTQGLNARPRKNNKFSLVVTHLITEHARWSLSFIKSWDVLTTQPRTPHWAWTASCVVTNLMVRGTVFEQKLCVIKIQSGVQIAQLVERWTAMRSNRVQFPVMPKKKIAHIFSGPPCPPSRDWVAGSPEIWRKVLRGWLASYPKGNNQLNSGTYSL